MQGAARMAQAGCHGCALCSRGFRQGHTAANCAAVAPTDSTVTGYYFAAAAFSTTGICTSIVTGPMRPAVGDPRYRVGIVVQWFARVL